MYRKTSWFMTHEWWQCLKQLKNSSINFDMIRLYFVVFTYCSILPCKDAAFSQRPTANLLLNLMKIMVLNCSEFKMFFYFASTDAECKNNTINYVLFCIVNFKTESWGICQSKKRQKVRKTKVSPLWNKHVYPSLVFAHNTRYRCGPSWDGVCMMINIF